MNAFGHELTMIQERWANGKGFATVSCRCGRWSRQTGWYVTPLVARRIARRLHKEHARYAGLGILTVTEGLTGPEMVADPDDERSFLRETVRFHLNGETRPRLLDDGRPEDEESVVSQLVLTPHQSELELHPVTIADLDSMAS